MNYFLNQNYFRLRRSVIKEIQANNKNSELSFYYVLKVESFLEFEKTLNWLQKRNLFEKNGIKVAIIYITKSDLNKKNLSLISKISLTCHENDTKNFILINKKPFLDISEVSENLKGINFSNLDSNLIKANGIELNEKIRVSFQNIFNKSKINVSPFIYSMVNSRSNGNSDLYYYNLLKIYLFLNSPLVKIDDKNNIKKVVFDINRNNNDWNREVVDFGEQVILKDYFIDLVRKITKYLKEQNIWKISKLLNLFVNIVYTFIFINNNEINVNDLTYHQILTLFPQSSTKNLLRQFNNSNNYFYVSKNAKDFFHKKIIKYKNMVSNENIKVLQGVIDYLYNFNKNFITKNNNYFLDIRYCKVIQTRIIEFINDLN